MSFYGRLRPRTYLRQCPSKLRRSIETFGLMQAPLLQLPEDRHSYVLTSSALIRSNFSPRRNASSSPRPIKFLIWRSEHYQRQAKKDGRVNSHWLLHAEAPFHGQGLDDDAKTMPLKSISGEGPEISESTVDEMVAEVSCPNPLASPPAVSVGAGHWLILPLPLSFQVEMLRLTVTWRPGYNAVSRRRRSFAARPSASGASLAFVLALTLAVVAGTTCRGAQL
jgi:hypothetical protein